MSIVLFLVILLVWATVGLFAAMVFGMAVRKINAAGDPDKSICQMDESRDR